MVQVRFVTAFEGCDRFGNPEPLSLTPEVTIFLVIEDSVGYLVNFDLFKQSGYSDMLCPCCLLEQNRADIARVVAQAQKEGLITGRVRWCEQSWSSYRRENGGWWDCWHDPNLGEDMFLDKYPPLQPTLFTKGDVRSFSKVAEGKLWEAAALSLLSRSGAKPRSRWSPN